ncbi:SGNH/GDSL hydrolase family protein [Jeotgalibacillus soli]|uniref:SGNH/GDSL hydrolase family protein n=1 Tax=Jeotgalibacillus soli TaxID=889306 RepID=UPI000696B572|nr:SGNH/GDSL hydrolase family protein [Jeotgalibacillus soli]
MKSFTKAGLVILSSVFLASCTIPSSNEQNEEREVLLETKPSPDETFIPVDLTIVSIGDSLTEGVGDSTGLGGYVPLLEQKLEEQDIIKEVEIINFGKRGNRSDQLLKRVQEDQEIRQSIEGANSVIVTIGGNDVMRVFRANFPSLTYDDFSAARVQYEERLSEVFSEIRSLNPEASIVLLGIYNPFFVFSADVQEMDMIVEEWNHAASDIASSWDHTSFVEVADIFKNSEDNLLHTDFFHPNDRGYSLIAERIEEGLMELMNE